MRSEYKPILFILLIMLVGCSSVDHYVSAESENWEQLIPPADSLLVFRTVLLGDTGDPEIDGSDPMLTYLNHIVEGLDTNSMIAFLGDNIYPDGLTGKGSDSHALTRNRIIAQLDAVKHTKGKIIFIPGNHDWGPGNISSTITLRRQEKFVENYLDRGNTFLPDSGYPGPVTLQLIEEENYKGIDKDYRLIVLDTEWWFRDKARPYGSYNGYELSDRSDFIHSLGEVISQYSDDQLIVLGHHPIFSNGNHGGKFALKPHLIPPIFGSFYIFYRKIFGLKQDLTRKNYENLREEFMNLFREQDQLIYASGHEHNLQYFKKESGGFRQHYVVSGSGSRTDYVRGGKGVAFASDKHGLMLIDLYSDGSLWLEVRSPVLDGSKGELLFMERLN